MNWERLKSCDCPYCDSKLEFDTINSIFKCTRCYFRISAERFKDIAKNRARPDGNYRKMNWERLHDGKCPACGSYLKESPGKFEIMICENTKCDTKMRQETIDRILADETHPANLFKKTK